MGCGCTLDLYIAWCPALSQEGSSAQSLNSVNAFLPAIGPGSHVLLARVSVTLIIHCRHCQLCGHNHLKHFDTIRVSGPCYPNVIARPFLPAIGPGTRLGKPCIQRIRRRIPELEMAAWSFSLVLCVYAALVSSSRADGERERGREGGRRTSF